MGVYAVAAAFAALLGILRAFGLNVFVVREPEIDADLMASAFTINLAVAALVALLVACFSVVAGTFLHEPGIRRVTLVLALIPLIGIFEFLPAARLERDSQFRAIAVMNLVRAGASNLIMIVLAVAGLSYMSMAWGQIAGAVVGAAGFMISGRQYVSFRLALTGWRQITVFGMQQLAIQGVNTLSQRISELLIGRLLGLSALGLYGRAAQLTNLLWYNVYVIMGRVILVDLAGQRRGGMDLGDRYLRTVEVISALLWPSYAGVAILAGPLIYIVYGPAWVAAAPPLSMLALASIGFLSLGMFWDIFVVCNQTSQLTRIECTRAGIGIILFAVGCFFNLITAAAARVLESFVFVALYLPRLERITDTQRSDYLRIFRRSAIATVLPCSPAFILMTIYGWSPHVPVGLVSAAIAAGVAVWLGILHLMDHPLSHEVRRLVVEGRRVAGSGLALRDPQ